MDTACTMSPPSRHAGRYAGDPRRAEGKHLRAAPRVSVLDPRGRWRGRQFLPREHHSLHRSVASSLHRLKETFEADLLHTAHRGGPTLRTARRREVLHGSCEGAPPSPKRVRVCTRSGPRTQGTRPCQGMRGVSLQASHCALDRGTACGAGRVARGGLVRGQLDVQRPPGRSADRPRTMCSPAGPLGLRCGDPPESSPLDSALGAYEQPGPRDRRQVQRDRRRTRPSGDIAESLSAARRTRAGQLDGRRPGAWSHRRMTLRCQSLQRSTCTPNGAAETARRPRRDPEPCPTPHHPPR